MSEVYMPKGGGKFQLDKIINLDVSVASENDSEIRGYSIIPGETKKFNFVFRDLDNCAGNIQNKEKNCVFLIGTIYAWTTDVQNSGRNRYIPAYVRIGKSEEYTSGLAKSYPIKIKYDATFSDPNMDGIIFEITNLSSFAIYVATHVFSTVIAFLPG